MVGHDFERRTHVHIQAGRRAERCTEAKRYAAHFETVVCLAFPLKRKIEIHIRQLLSRDGRSPGIRLARSLRAAVAIDPAAAGEVPSTKGVL